jgi:hypothetical protein
VNFDLHDNPITLDAWIGTYDKHFKPGALLSGDPCSHFASDWEFSQFFPDFFKTTEGGPVKFEELEDILATPQRRMASTHPDRVIKTKSSQFWIGRRAGWSGSAWSRYGWCEFGESFLGVTRR